MAFLFPLSLCAIFFFCMAFLYRDGMWSNAIRLFNVVTASLLAINFWEPVARMAEGFGGFIASLTFYLDFLVLWGLFCVLMIIFQTLTNTFSKVKVRFLSLADRIGSPIFAAWIGWVMICFTTMTLHTAPLGRTFMFGGFQPEKRMFLVGPDRLWLGFMQKMSRGTFSRRASEEELQKKTYGTGGSEVEQNLCVFDRKGEFLPKYASRRAGLETYYNTNKSFRVPADKLGSQVARR